MNKYLNRILDDSTELTTTTSLAVKYYEAYNRYIAGGQKRRADKLESTYKQTISFPYLNDPRLDSVLIRKGEIRYYYTQTYRPTKDTKRLHLFSAAASMPSTAAATTSRTATRSPTP